ncbi:MAG: UvrD-helicase domain-containing protein [Betaproteobacteria bacterium]
MADLLEQLNPEQLAAVTLPRVSALILAGAGSGKTRVLTTRIAWLISTGQVSPYAILAVTFTNKAAREMQLRLSAMLAHNIRGMWIGTFHGLCNRFLRAHHTEAQLPALFQILDTQDQLALIKRLYKSMNVDDERYPARQLQYFISGSKEQGLRPNQVEAFDDHTRRQVELYAAYEQLCQREGAVDFSELLLRSYEVLARSQSLREHYQHRFQHILIDEFQDTNVLQYRWLRLLGGKSTSMFAVGDDDQSIYAFRGADIGNMQRFQQDFAPIELIKLEQNYRSHGNILDAANALIRNNQTRLGKNLWTREGKGEPLRVYVAPTEYDEALFLVDAIKGLIGDGVKADEIAVLYRSNAQSRIIEHSLFNAAIPYRVYGGMRFFERAEVKHALAYLRLLSNPGDDGSLLRVINFPPRGVGVRTLEGLQATAQASGVTLWQAACSNPPSGRAGAGVGAFVRLIDSLGPATAGMRLSEAVDHVIASSGLVDHYKNEKDAQERLDNLRELVAAADLFERESRSDSPSIDPTGAPADPLTAFLAHAALEAGDTQAAAGREALQMMTVHSAKGLEFHTVFVTGLEEGLFPHDNSMNDLDGPEEERRLMYVALTRARRRLYLTFAQSRSLHGQFRYKVPSRFLDEIPPALMQWLSATPKNLLAEVTASRFDREPVMSPASNDSRPGFRIGQNVHHPRFGSGVIVNAEGRGADARVQVNFRDAGLKWLSLEFAKLEAA